MNDMQYAALAMDYKNMMCYICDINTYEILYVNQATKDFFLLQSKEHVKCYEVFQNETKPCSFCRNHMLKIGQPICYEKYYKTQNQYLEVEEHLANIEGRMCRIVFSQDLGLQKQKMQRLQTRLSAEETLVRCMQILMQEADTELAVNHILEIVGKFYQASRAYIFENNPQKGVFHNTYEWCEAGVCSYIEKLQNVSLQSIQPWLDKFQADGEMMIYSIKNMQEAYPDLPLPTGYDAKNIFLVPLMREKEVVGFIGVDNLQANQEQTALLRSMAYFLLNDLDKRRRFQQLEYTSYTDMLTGLRNRNKYLKMLQEYESHPPKSMGVVFIDVNGMKTINDTHGHSYGDFIIKKIATILRACMGENIFRIGGDEFVSLSENISEVAFAEKVHRLREHIQADEEVCVSIGSIWKEGQINVKEEVFSADELMYEEKQAYYKKLVKEGRSKAHDVV